MARLPKPTKWIFIATVIMIALAYGATQFYTLGSSEITMAERKTSGWDAGPYFVVNWAVDTTASLGEDYFTFLIRDGSDIGDTGYKAGNKVGIDVWIKDLTSRNDADVSAISVFIKGSPISIPRKQELKIYPLRNEIITRTNIQVDLYVNNIKHGEGTVITIDPLIAAGTYWNIGSGSNKIRALASGNLDRGFTPQALEGYVIVPSTNNNYIVRRADLDNLLVRYEQKTSYCVAESLDEFVEGFTREKTLWVFGGCSWEGVRSIDQTQNLKSSTVDSVVVDTITGGWGVNIVHPKGLVAPMTQFWIKEDTLGAVELVVQPPRNLQPRITSEQKSPINLKVGQTIFFDIIVVDTGGDGGTVSLLTSGDTTKASIKIIGGGGTIPLGESLIREVRVDGIKVGTGAFTIIAKGESGASDSISWNYAVEDVNLTVDTDGDGIPDGLENSDCIEIFGKRADGCPISDVISGVNEVKVTDSYIRFSGDNIYWGKIWATGLKPSDDFECPSVLDEFLMRRAANTDDSLDKCSVFAGLTSFLPKSEFSSKVGGSDKKDTITYDRLIYASVKGIDDFKVVESGNVKKLETSNYKYYNKIVFGIPVVVLLVAIFLLIKDPIKKKKK